MAEGLVAKGKSLRTQKRTRKGIVLLEIALDGTANDFEACSLLIVDGTCLRLINLKRNAEREGYYRRCMLQTLY